MDKEVSKWNSILNWIIAILIPGAMGLLYNAGYGPNCEKCRLASIEAPKVDAAAIVNGVAGSASVALDATSNVVSGTMDAAANINAAVEAPKAEAKTEEVKAEVKTDAKAEGVPPAAKIHYDVAKTAFPDDGSSNLKAVLAYLKAHSGAKAKVTGFHDKTGSQEINTKIANERAAGVKAALVKSGIDAERVSIVKPQQSTGSGSDDEARRVEVSVMK